MTGEDLKRTVLQAAVQGKLSERLDTDTPASELLRDCSAEPSSVDAEMEPFELPEGWEWAKLGDLCDYGRCSNIEFADVEDGVWNLDLEDVEKDSGRVVQKNRKGPEDSGSTKHAFKKGMVLYSKLRPYLNKVIVADEDGVCTSEILPLDFRRLNPRFMQACLMEPGFVNYANRKENTSGVKMPRLKRQAAVEYVLGVPPLEEQERIVAKLDEVMPLIEEYGRLQEQRDKLDAELPEKLRKAVLNYALEGNFCPQNDKQQSAGYVESLKQQKTALLKERMAFKSAHDGSEILPREGGSFIEVIGNKVTDFEPQFSIPDNWEWVRLGAIASVIRDGTHQTPHYTEEGIPFLSIQNISKGFFDDSKMKYISREEHEELTSKVKPQNGDILLCRIGTLGKPWIVNLDFEFSIFVSLGLIRLVDPALNWLFCTYFSSGYGCDWINDNKIGAGTHTPKIPLKVLAGLALPIPPLEEQERIVAKLDEVMPLVDGLRR